jgi:hypothetical protein
VIAQPAPGREARVVAPLTAGLVALGATQFVVGLPLVLAPAQTERFFAWTIDVPLTAAFLGACYWSGAAFSLLSASERTWARARTAIPGALTAGVLILLATVLHLDRFAMDTARGWIWLVLYAGLPPGLLLVVLLQARARGPDPPVTRPLEPWVRIVFTAGAAILLLVGAALCVVPAHAAAWWPWPLTELTARMAGSWLAAVGVVLLAALREGDWSRLRAATAFLALVAALQLLTLARFPGALEAGAAAWLYVGFLAGLLGVALYGLLAPRLAGDGPETRG